MERQKNINLAIISPNKDAYSETFIQAQKELLPFNNFLYHNGFFPTALNGNILSIKSFFLRIKIKLQKKSYKSIALEKSFQKNNINIVLAQYGPTGEEISDICEKLRIPLIIHFHGFDASDTNIIKIYKNYNKSFKVANAIIVVSNRMYRDLLEMGCPKEKLHKITYGPNDSFFSIIPKYNEMHFIGLGRFVEKKAPYYTILAFSKVLKSFPNAKLTIGGDGILHPICKNIIRYLGISDSVFLPGVLTKEQFIKYLSTSIAFVQHSIRADSGDSEGTPVAVLEACAAGVPVISTRHAGIPDVVIDGKTGVLVDEHDVDGMAEAMSSLLANTNFAITLGTEARQQVWDHFRMDMYIGKLSKIIYSSCNVIK